MLVENLANDLLGKIEACRVWVQLLIYYVVELHMRGCWSMNADMYVNMQMDMH